MWASIEYFIDGNAAVQQCEITDVLAAHDLALLQKWDDHKCVLE